MDLNAVHLVAAATLVAAFIAALVSLVTLVNTKEQKTTEFRQAWINSLRAEAAKFASQARYIAGAIHNAKRFDPNCFSRDSKAYEAYAENRKEIAVAYYLISLHFKPDDLDFQRLAQLMDKVLNALGRPERVTFEEINSSLRRMTEEVRTLLKEEWERVKAGEAPYKWTKRVAIVLMLVLFFVFIGTFSAVRYGWLPNLATKGTPQSIKSQ